MFPNEETARIYLEGRLWKKGPVCPTCGCGDRLTPRKQGFYRCNQCQLDFTIRTGTIFERSHIPLHKWLYAMYLLVTSRKGISSMQLAKEIGITQKSAWFMLGRLRERGGRVIAHPVANTDKEVLQGAIMDHVEVGSQLMTDEASGYSGIGGLFFDHDTVAHSAGEYSRGSVNTNSIESVWAVMKRGMHGVYHHASPKHLHRYVDEFTFRLNEGDVKRHTLDRLDSFIDAVDGKRLTYARLIQ
jgi:transposase-like protein